MQIYISVHTVANDEILVESFNQYFSRKTEIIRKAFISDNRNTLPQPGRLDQKTDEMTPSFSESEFE